MSQDIDIYLDTYQAALLADGWQATPLYGNRPAELTGSLKFEREGFIIQLYRAPSRPTLAAWGPDRLAVDLPDAYDWAALVANTRKCSKCGAVGETVRVGFAGRVCPTCRPIVAVVAERGNWTA